MSIMIGNVISSIRAFFTPPVFPDDDDKTMRTKILAVLLLNMSVFLFLTILGMIFVFVNKLASSVIIAVLLAFLLISYLLLKRGRLLAASYLFTLGYWILFVLAVVLTGKITTAFVSLLVASIIIAGVLIGGRDTIILIVLSSLISLGLAILESTGYPLPRIFPAPPLTNWVLLALSFFLSYSPVKIAIERASQALARARQSEKRYKALYEDAPVMYLTTVGRENVPIISSCNQFFLQTLGYQRDEVIGQPLGNFYTPESRKALMDGGGYQRVAQGGGKVFVERHLVAKDGEIIHTLLQATPEIGENGQVVGVLAVFLNITERRQAEEKLQTSEALLRKIADNYPNSFISIIEKDLRVGFTSGQEFKKQGLTPDSFVGLTLEQVFGEHAPMIKEKYMKAFEGEEVEFELYINNQYQLYHVTPLLEDGLPVDRILSVVENITERRQAEEKLRISEEKFAKAFRSSPDVLVLTSLTDGLIVDVNDRTEEVLGYTYEEAVGKTVFDLQIWPDPSQREQYTASLRRDGFVRDWEVQMRSKSGKLIDVLLSGEILEIRGEKYILGMLRDITSKKQAEEILHATTTRLETMINVSPLAVILLDREDCIQIWNPAAERMFGWRAVEVLGKPNPIVTPSRQDEYKDLSAQVFGGTPIIDQETVRQHKDGTSIDVSLSSAPIYSSSGELVGRMAIVVDITARKHAEMELQKQVTELRLWHQATLGREERIIELKREINDLLVKAGKESKYL